jgi:hypothetical protein
MDVRAAGTTEEERAAALHLAIQPPREDGQIRETPSLHGNVRTHMLTADSKQLRTWTHIVLVTGPQSSTHLVSKRLAEQLHLANLITHDYRDIALQLQTG